MKKPILIIGKRQTLLALAVKEVAAQNYTINQRHSCTMDHMKRIAYNQVNIEDSPIFGKRLIIVNDCNSLLDIIQVHRHFSRMRSTSPQFALQLIFQSENITEVHPELHKQFIVANTRVKIHEFQEAS